MTCRRPARTHTARASPSPPPEGTLPRCVTPQSPQRAWEASAPACSHPRFSASTAKHGPRTLPGHDFRVASESDSQSFRLPTCSLRRPHFVVGGHGYLPRAPRCTPRVAGALDPTLRCSKATRVSPSARRRTPRRFCRRAPQVIEVSDAAGSVSLLVGQGWRPPPPARYPRAMFEVSAADRTEARESLLGTMRRRLAGVAIVQLVIWGSHALFYEQMLFDDLAFARGYRLVELVQCLALLIVVARARSVRRLELAALLLFAGILPAHGAALLRVREICFVPYLLTMEWAQPIIALAVLLSFRSALVLFGVSASAPPKRPNRKWHRVDASGCSSIRRAGPRSTPARAVDFGPSWVLPRTAPCSRPSRASASSSERG